MSVESSILVGSIVNMAAQTMTVDGTGYEVSASLSGIYLYDGTSSLSLLAQVQTHLNTELSPANVTVKLTDAGKVKITSDGANFTITWTDSDLRDWLGFTGNLSGAATYTADNISPLIWIPNRAHTPEMAPTGVHGSTEYDISQSTAPGGATTTFRHGTTNTKNRIRWDYVPAAYWQTSSANNGEFATFWAEVLSKGANWKHYEYASVDLASGTSDLSWPSSVLGPYIEAPARPILEMMRSSGFEAVEQYYDEAIDALKVPEYA